MIVVEIPKALADHPEVVPVDPWHKGRVIGWCASAEFVDVTESLVGQRVALAYWETCPTCNGEGGGYIFAGPGVYDWEDCPDCSDGSRMVVGWTAEVAEVLPRADVADWSPGRYALVLRDVRPYGALTTCGQRAFPPVVCRPFFGFAKLDEVLG